MIVGDDRADFLDTIADSFLFKNENINSVNGQILTREDMDEYKKISPEKLSQINISEMPVSAFSASFVRKLVKLGMKDKFDDVYKLYLSQDKIDHLFEIISQGLTKPDPESKKSDDKPPKYSYPIIRGDDQFNEILIKNAAKAAEKASKKSTPKQKKGGKKTKQKKRKTRKIKRKTRKIKRKTRKYKKY
jgi:hypothetical protein